MLQIVYFTLGAEVDGVELTVTHAYLVRDAVSLQQKDILGHYYYWVQILATSLFWRC